MNKNSYKSQILLLSALSILTIAKLLNLFIELNDFIDIGLSLIAITLFVASILNLYKNKA